MNIGALYATLGLRLDRRSFSQGEQVLGKLKHAAVRFFEFETAVKAAEFFKGVIEGAMETGAELEKMSAKTGLGVEALQELQSAAYHANISQEDLATSLRFLQRNMFAAAQGGKEQARAFKTVGVSIKDQNGNLRDVDKVLGDVAEQFFNMPDGAKKTALAMQVFGRGGAALIPLLNKGRKGIDDQREAFKALGFELTDRQVGKLGKAEDAVKTLHEQWTGFKNFLGAELAPIVTDLIGKLTTWIKANKDLIRTKVHEFAIAVGSGIRKLIGFLREMKPVLDGVISAFRWIVNHPELVKSIAAVVLALKGLNILKSTLTSLAGLPGAFAAALGPIGAFVAAVTGLILLIQKFNPEIDEFLNKIGAHALTKDITKLTAEQLRRGGAAEKTIQAAIAAGQVAEPITVAAPAALTDFTGPGNATVNAPITINSASGDPQQIAKAVGDHLQRVSRDIAAGAGR